MTNLNNLITSLISQYPTYNKSDIQELDNLAQYADQDTMSLIGKFLYTVYYMDGKDSLTFLHAILSQLDTEEAATHEDEYNATQSYSYTVTDGYLPQPLEGTIEANSLIEADQLIREIYASELDTEEADLIVYITGKKDYFTANIRTYNDIRTVEDIRIWATEYNNPSDVHVEFNDHIVYLYRKGNYKSMLNLQAINENELMNLIDEVGIEVREF